MSTGKSLTNAEKLSLVMSAKEVIESDYGDCSSGHYPENVLFMLDDINDEHLFAYLTDHVYRSDTIRKPVIKALFADIPIILEEIDDIDESGYSSMEDYLKELDERICLNRFPLIEVYWALSAGRSITIISRHNHRITGELVYERRFDINGHDAQRRAALANEVAMYVHFPEYINWEISLLKGPENCPLDTGIKPDKNADERMTS